MDIVFGYLDEMEKLGLMFAKAPGRVKLFSHLRGLKRLLASRDLDRVFNARIGNIERKMAKADLLGDETLKARQRYYDRRVQASESYSRDVKGIPYIRGRAQDAVDAMDAAKARYLSVKKGLVPQAKELRELRQQERGMRKRVKRLLKRHDEIDPLENQLDDARLKARIGALVAAGLIVPPAAYLAARSVKKAVDRSRRQA